MSLLNNVAVIAALMAPKFTIGEPIKVTKGEYLGCIGNVLDVYQPMDENKYDLELTKCTNKWVKAPYKVYDVVESAIARRKEY
jgi:hypothetical protein